MSQAEQAPVIESVPELLAHALELECASQAHYEQLADSMDVHHNSDVAALFRRLAELSAEHAEAVAERATDLALPRIPPWAFKWECPNAPEGADCLDPEVSYSMNRLQALEVSLHNERRAHDFYRQTAATAAVAEARRLAAEMAAEEAEHVALLEGLLAEQRRKPDDASEDLDPPHMPA